MTDLLENEQISAGQYPTKYILAPYDGAKWLLVVFSAFALDNSPNQHIYNFMNVLQDVPAHKLYIQDTQGQRGVYYLCRQLDFGVSEEVCTLIRSVQENLECDADHTVSIGSSKGGSAALYFGLRLRFAHVLSMVPQFHIGTYLNSPRKQSVLEEMIGKENVSSGIEMLNGIIEAELKKNTTTKVHVLTSHFDEQYETQIAPLEQAVKAYQRQEQCNLRFDDRIKGHNGAANRNADFVHEQLMGILFDCNLSVKDGILKLTKNHPDVSEYNIIYLVEKRDGTSQEYHLEDAQYTFSLQELSYTELTVWKGRKVIYQRYFCDWLSDLLHVECSRNKSGIRLKFVQDSSCPLPMQYSFYIKDKKNAILERVPPSTKTEHSITRSDLDGGSIQYFFRYKNYVHWDTVPIAAIPSSEVPIAEKEAAKTEGTPCDIDKLDYTITCRDQTLFFSLDVPKATQAQFAYYVRRDNEIIQKIGYGPHTQLAFPLEVPGSYFVSYFVRQNGNSRSKESKSIYYQPYFADLYGPEALESLLKTCSIYKTSSQESEFAVIDLLDIAQQWVPSIFPSKNACKTAVDSARESLREILSRFSGQRVFLLQWRLWPQEESLRTLHWVLEELYDCARSAFGHALWELPVILPQDVWQAGATANSLYSLCQPQLLEALSKISSLEIEYEISQANVRLEITDGILSAVLEHPGHRPTDRYGFYVFHDGALLERTSLGEAMELTRPVTGSGVYMVQAYLKRGDLLVLKKSAPVSFHTKSEQDAFERFLREANELDISSPLPFYASKPPFCDICLVTRTDREQTELKVLPRVARLYEGELHTSIYSNGHPMVLSNGSSLLLSGLVMLDGHLRMGMQELPQDLTGTELADQTGQYSCAVWRDGIVRLDTDFFCFKHWYYYQAQDLFVACNSYHLLLLTLKELGISLALDTRKACVTLAGNVHTLTQNFTRHMDVKGVYQLAPEQRLVLQDGAWSVERSELGEIFSHTAPYHEESYRALLNQAAKELIDNCRQILSDPHYDDISVDLSGGLDSRIVYSAMTNLPESAGRIKINSRDTSGSQDLPIALSINQLYKYPYDDFPRSYYALSPKTVDEIHRSFYLGVYYSYAPTASARPENKSVSVTGALGDAITRPYMGLHRKYMTSPIAHLSSSSAFVEEFYRELGAGLVLGSEKVTQTFVSFFSQELEDIGPTDYFKGLTHMYLAYRNSYHFYGIGSTLNYHVAFPIQSKALLRLSDMVFSVHKGIRMTLDLIYHLNPVVASFPYDSQEDQDELERLRPELTMDPCFRMLRMELAPQTEPWEQANLRKRAVTKSIPSPQPQDNASHDMGMRSLLCAFRSLMVRYPDLRDVVGLDLYHLFTATKMASRHTAYWRNKLFSLLDQSNLCDFSGEAH